MTTENNISGTPAAPCTYPACACIGGGVFKECVRPAAPSSAPSSEAKSTLTPAMENQAAFHAACERRNIKPCQDLFSLWQDARTASPASQPVEAARYELRMRAPNGHLGPWHEVVDTTFQKFSANPDIGDGFTYEARALYTGPALQAAQTPIQAAGLTDEQQAVMRKVVKYLDNAGDVMCANSLRAILAQQAKGDKE